MATASRTAASSSRLGAGTRGVSAAKLSVPQQLPSRSSSPRWFRPTSAISASCPRAGPDDEIAGGGARRLQQRAQRLQGDPEPAARADHFEATAAGAAWTGALSGPQQDDQHLQGPHRRGSLPDRQAQQVQHSAGVFRCRQRAADRRVSADFHRHAGAARQRAGFGHAVQGRRRSCHRHRPRQGPRRRDRRRGRPHQPRHVLCRDQRQSEHGQRALEQVQGKPADRRVRGSKRSAEMGRDQEVDRSLRPCTDRARQQGRGAGRQAGPALQSLDRGAKRPDERPRRAVRANPDDHAGVAGSDRSDEILRADPDRAQSRPSPHSDRAT